jgi:hypothetical protein
MDLSRLDADPVTAVDPNVLLHRLRELAQEVLADLDDPETAADVTGGEASLATDFLALDDWLSRGGFLPHPWQPDAP